MTSVELSTSYNRYLLKDATRLTAVIRAAGGPTGALDLRLWTPRGAAVRSLRQVAPTATAVDLTAERAPVSEQVGAYRLADWDGAERAFVLYLDLEPDRVGAEVRAARVEIAAGADVLGRASVIAEWTSDDELSVRIDPDVARYTGRTGLAQAIEAAVTDQAKDELEAAMRMAAAPDEEALYDGLNRLNNSWFGSVDTQMTRTTSAALRRDDGPPR